MTLTLVLFNTMYPLLLSTSVVSLFTTQMLRWMGPKAHLKKALTSDISLSMDDGDNISEDELDRDIMQLMYCPKPTAARGAPKNLKRQPDKPRGSSKPVLTSSASADKPETRSKL